jgi:hypothetical protein
MSDFRTDWSSHERAMPVGHYIDPGFVNHRLVETVVGDVGPRCELRVRVRPSSYAIESALGVA